LQILPIDTVPDRLLYIHLVFNSLRTFILAALCWTYAYNVIAWTDQALMLSV